jgi:hypothetical protein
VPFTGRSRKGSYSMLPFQGKERKEQHLFWKAEGSTWCGSWFPHGPATGGGCNNVAACIDD